MKFPAKITGQTGDNGRRDVEITVPLLSFPEFRQN